MAHWEKHTQYVIPYCHTKVLTAVVEFRIQYAGARIITFIIREEHQKRNKCSYCLTRNERTLIPAQFNYERIPTWILVEKSELSLPKVEQM